MDVVAAVRERDASTHQMWYNANHLDKVSYIQLVVLVIGRIGRAFLKTPRSGCRCMTRCQFVSMWAERA